jgi:hypothetical protein
MLTRLFRRCARRGRSLARALRERLSSATKPAEPAMVTDALADLVRSRPALVAENAFLCQPLPGQAPGAAACPAGDPAPLASAGFPPLLTKEVAAPIGTTAEGGGRDDRADPGAGRRESAVGRRAYPG